MPRVPTYGGPQVRSEPLRPVQQREIDVSSGSMAVARGLGQVSEVLDTRIRRDAEIEANSADNQITSGWLQWDAENRRKYQGRNVGEYEAKAAEWWDKAKTTYASALSPLAQSAVDNQLGRKRNSAMGSVLAHVSAEKERTADGEYDAAQKADVQWAVTTGDTVTAALGIRKRASELIARKGLGTDAYEVEVLTRVGSMHAAVIEGMADRDAAGALKYYDEAKKRNEIPSGAQPRIEKILTGELENQKAKQLAAQNAKLPLAEQLAAGADLPPSLQEKYLTTVKNNHALVKAALQESEQAAATNAWVNYVDKGKRVPAALRKDMGETNLKELIRFEQDRARHFQAEGNKPIKTDPDTHRDLWALFGDNRDKFAEVNLRQYGAKLATADYEQLVKLQSDIRTGKGQKDQITFTNKVNAAINQMELTGEKHAKDRGELQRAAQTDWERAAASGKPPTPKQEDEILDSLTKTVVLEKRAAWFDKTGPGYKLNPQQREVMFDKTPPRRRVATVEEARALPPGTRFIDPQGIERVR